MPESASPPTTSESTDSKRAWMGIITPYALAHLEDSLACVRDLSPQFSQTLIVVTDGWQAYTGNPAPDIVRENIDAAKEQGITIAGGLQRAVIRTGIERVGVRTVSQMRELLQGTDTTKGVANLDELAATCRGFRHDLRDTAALQLGSNEHREWRAHFAQLQVELALRMLRAGYQTKIGLLDDDRTIDGITAKLLCGGYPDIAPEHLDSRSIYTRPGQRLVPRKRRD